MRDSWQIVALGELARQSIDPISVEPEVAYVNLGVQWYAKGVFFREPKIGSEIKAKTLFRVRPGQFIYNRLFATEGSFALVTAEAAEGVVSNEFPVFDLDEQRILPDFLFLHFQQPAIWEQVAAECVGTTKSRKRWKEDRFTQHVIALPPLVEQRRIVDLLGTIDDTIEDLTDSLLSIRRLLAALRQHTTSTDSVALGSLVRMRSGPSWKAADESTTPTPGATPVLGITNTKPDGNIDLSPRKYVIDLPASAEHLDKNSLVMIRTNGNRSRIGNIYRATREVQGFAVSAFQFAIQPLDPRDSGYLYWFLGSASIQDRITAAASGTTGLGNIAQGWLKELQVPYPANRRELEKYVARCESVHAVVQAYETQAAALVRTRSHLLSLLLSGEHEIPESYDELVEGVA